jgi:hypothetical protein
MDGFRIVQRPAHGTVEIGPLFVRYKSRPGYVGSDSFTYQRSGRTALGAPNERTVHIDVTVIP